jgi:hypothetical protein
MLTDGNDLDLDVHNTKAFRANIHLNQPRIDSCGESCCQTQEVTSMNDVLTQRTFVEVTKARDKPDGS